MKNHCNENNKENNTCLCKSEHGLFISKRQTSSIVAGLLFCSAGIFTFGYFRGKHDSIDAWNARLEQDIFADNIYMSLCSLSETENAQNEQEQDILAQIEEDKQEDLLMQSEVVTKVSLIEEQKIEIPQKNTLYYAELIGFGSKKSANAFAAKQAKKDIKLIVKERHSTGSKGKKVSWYQIITPDYNDHEKLTTIVDRITKEEKLNGTRIVTRTA
jgi:hypothetical protein